MIKPFSIFLAEDDDDDCLLFTEALKELPLLTSLTVLRDGEKLMQLLTRKETEVPHVLFLDLNMPRKNGYECLCEIKQNKILEHLPVIILSTSFDRDMAKELYENGACYYLRKPGEFSGLKLIIHKALGLLFGIKTKSIEEKFAIIPPTDIYKQNSTG